jgi:hypothetical protein
MTAQRLMDGFLVAGGLLVGLGALACSLEAPMPAFQMYTPAIESASRITVRVFPSEISSEQKWGTSGPVPRLIVTASTTAHPGSVRVEIRRRSLNASGGLQDELQDLGHWTASQGQPSTYRGVFSGQQGPLQAGDLVVFQIEASPSKGDIR